MSQKARSLLPHETLLLACATPFQTDETRYAVGATASHPGLDWPAEARMSLQHGIAPCVAMHLGDLAAEKRVPDAVAACFARLHSANAARNLVMFREASRLQRALVAHGVACLILKGAALSLTAYPTHALRNFADIDLLVAPEDYTAACAVVIQLAVAHRVEGHVYRSLELAYRAFNASIPTETLAPLAQMQRRRASRLALSLPKVLIAPVQDRRAGFLRRLALTSDTGQLGASLLSTLVPPPLVMRRIYGVQHPLLIAALYPLRPLLLLIRLAGHLLRRLRHPAR